MLFTTIEYSVTNRVATIRLNRPGRMNAINAPMHDELLAAAAAAVADDGVRCVRLAAAGTRAFCAGADLQATGDEKPAGAARSRERDIHPERTLNVSFLAMEKPLIAAVNGVAVGGGLALALASDIIVAADTATFGTAHVRLALPLVDMLGYLLPRRVGPGRAADLAFSGRIITAAEALGMGLVERVVPAADLERESTALAESIAAKAPLALKFSKEAIRRSDNEDWRSYVRYERYIFQTAFTSEDAKEAVRALREKREPEFGGY